MGSTRMKWACAIVGAAVLGVAPAASANTYTGEKVVSCDVTITTQLAILYHSTTGPISIKQVTSSPALNSYHWATSDNGNSTAAKALGNGGTANWSNVLPSNYRFKTHVVSSQNCNGFQPGDGNSTMKFTASTLG